MAVKITGMPEQLTRAQCDKLRLELIKLQGGRCALCEARFVDIKAKPCLDHDHKTGLIRQVLCSNCNGMEGKIFDKANRAKRKKSLIEWLEDLIKYWKYHKENPSTYIYYNHGKVKKKRRRKF